MRKKEKKQKVSNGQIYLKSFKFFKGIFRNSIILGILYIILASVGIIIPIIQGNLVTNITLGKNSLVIKFAIILFILVILENIFAHSVLMFWLKQIRPKILNNIRQDIIEIFMKLRLSNFKKFDSGIFLERIESEPRTISGVINTSQKHLVQCLTKLGALVYVFYINWILGLLYLAGIIIVAIIDSNTQEISKIKNKMSKIRTCPKILDKYF